MPLKNCTQQQQKAFFFQCLILKSMIIFRCSASYIQVLGFSEFNYGELIF